MPVEGPLQRYTWSSCSGCACPNHHIPIHVSKDGASPTDTIPDFNHLERSNDPPLPGETETLRSMILDSEESITAISKEIEEMCVLRMELLKDAEHLANQASILRHKRRVLNEGVRYRKALLSPVRRLPVEVLALIFHEAIEFPWKSVYSPSLDWDGFDLERPFENPLWSIASVSRQWRETALLFPELWAFINIALTDGHFADGQYRYLRFIGLHLLRSGSRPLSVAIYDNGNSSFEELPLTLLGSLFPFVSRIHHLHLYLPSSIIASLYPLRPSFQQLRTLVIASMNDTMDYYGDLRIFDVAPELHIIKTINIAYPSISFILPWANITHYENHYYFATTAGPLPVDLLENLKAMENLTSCFLRCEQESLEDDLEGMDVPIVCQSLQSLEIASPRTCESEAISQILDRLHLPSLSTLRVSVSFREENEITFQSVRLLIERSRCNLSSLLFNNGVVRSEDLLCIFDQTPTLEVVELFDVGPDAITDQLLAKLTCREGDAKHLLPRLRSLALYGSFVFTMDIYASMIESRWKCASESSQVDLLVSVTLLKDVNLLLFKKEKATCQAIRQRLAPLRSEGLEMVVRIIPVSGLEGEEEEKDDDEDDGDDTESSRDD
ncbi:hypothetical protein ARMGADRAFT_1167939 [Armillaria gallica]|uniref:Uncharacterized protein n=1 Tax=Armillaria gallica TaxID=47427 RepID=A0A2H3CZJ4_ARMGA|nr:hypothetical protein ARMGADRAFT_1167939 [Armillaria gallica]